MRTPTLLALLAALAAPAALPSSAAAQGFGRRGEGRAMPEDLGEIPYDGRLTFARIRFELRDPRGGWAGGQPPWAHDYPRAERNFMTILSEITTARAFRGGSRIVALGDPELFNYPIAYMSEPGHWAMSDREAEAFRAYLRKGGFVIFDDFAGQDWFNFEAMMRRVIPDVEFVRMTVEHPIFHAFFEIETLELRHPNRRDLTAEFFGIFEDNDPGKRLLAIVNYNTDIGDYFEYSDTGFLPVDLSNDAYKLGVNYWMYALTR
ncbi:MAG TPA: DUF4159 domain-containing protein [Longimicrobiales bacterium]|nr:DUF4159 domain-containing protein [Longimicrobiales bacterium]